MARQRIRPEQHAQALHELRIVEEGSVIHPVSDEVLSRAGRRFPVEPIRTLDAIHLATAEQLLGPGTRVILFSYDARLRENALALGLEIV
jgi:predicted nucleic acid-binding protein